jgi:ABC-type sugar transport system ATPase subunit
MALGNRVAVMNHGRIEQIGTPREIRNQPANVFILEFLGTILGVT